MTFYGLRVAAIAAGILFALAQPSAALAIVISWQATLDAAQEVPAPTGVPPLAAGTATGTLDTDSGLLSWALEWSGLSGPATGAHFHGPAPAGVTAGVQVNIGVISGLASPSIGSAVISLSQQSDLLNGLWYINVHTAQNPPGEIRGQVAVLPEPAGVAIFGLGLTVLGLASRRRRRRRRRPAHPAAGRPVPAGAAGG